jgi:EAL domain-containing protein (putative c-di-GMP-specific phosphodiesterase class I)
MAGGEESRSGELLRPLDWSRRIEEALERDLFVLHAQRIVDVITGMTVRHELFLRMVDRKRLIPAGEFVMAAEEFGSIREIDRWVIARSIEIAATGRPVDLNLSVRSTDEAMVDLIRDLLGETGADPNDVVLELSETQLTEGLDAAGAFVNAVAELGCQIALDGAPFIDGLAEDRGKRRSVSSAVLKAHRSGKRVIAQGVESVAALELLEDLGIDEAQGNALGPPESIESLTGASA